MNRTFIVLLSLAIIVALSCKKQTSNIKETRTVDISYLENRLDLLSNKMEDYLPQVEIDSNRIPRSIDENGKLDAQNSRQWTSGFFPGTLWELAYHSKSPALIENAKIWSAFIEKEKWDTHTHDLGFKVNSPFGWWNKVAHSQKNDDIIVQASKTLIKRYNPKIGAIKSWDWGKDRWQFPVIIDNMMNLEMLFDATDISGDSVYYHIAKQHAETTLAHHFRADHSSYHVVDYDTITGLPRNKLTHQGLSDDSDWARGQAWGLYGFAMAYDRTGHQPFFDHAVKIADFFFTHPNMPDDLIPYWDFEAKNIPNEAKDVSAAAVAVCGLMKLSKHPQADNNKYMEWVDTVISALDEQEYQTDAVPFLLTRSTGSVPDSFEVDVPISYGDYFYVQALIERLELAK